MSIAPDLKACIDDLVVANRVLARFGVLDGFGHVSVRHPHDAQRFLLSRSLAPELVTADDIMEFGMDSEVASQDDRKPYLERYIHGEIYRARPDVHAVVHSHSPSVIPFAGSSVRLQPIYHMAGFLGGGAPVFDIRCCFGHTDMLVRNRDHGKALAQALGDRQVSLMRGHGFVAVGGGIPVAVYRAIYTEMNAALQQKAIGLNGEVTYLSQEEAALADEMMAGVMNRPWELWKKKAFE
ncbi:class II aldolase/adducin family protein [Bordetella petrii]|jgi:ribulose-5-phosphate 4-epimerase/fuculose-1-phosphate aldolase|uniref:Aldolase domain protein, Class II n=1 Tax=Bordetella petrii (strain ATCC BAA-461 / DSM 12804 / CCUG 43448 / CIP 107267 / Se-1111R) TaxID=340100 RepID=A9I653_BORPD|nr:class II aldolase/adducin family protein [Bordetella petrii]CAP44268.1 Aldolase domain protein, Class II [Bordetella petrii]